MAGEIALLKSLFSGKPYFGSAFMANDGQEHDPQLDYIVNLLLQKKRGLKVLVVGAWLGRTVHYLASVLSEKDEDWKILCLEDFHTPVEFISKTGSVKTHMTRFYEDAKEEGVLENLLLHNIKHSPGSKQIILNIQSSIEAFDALTDDTFDLIFINGARAVPGFQDIVDLSADRCNMDGIVCGTGLILQKNQVHPEGHAHAMRHTHGLFYVFDEQTDVRYFPEITEFFHEFSEPYDSTCGFWAFVAGDTKNHMEIPGKISITKTETVNTEHFRIIKSGKDDYLGVNNSISESALFQEKLGERDIPGLIYKADSKEKVLEDTQRFEHKEYRKRGVLLGETEHYYFGKYGKDTYLAQSKLFIPPARIRIFDETLGETELPPSIIKSETLEGLKQKAAKYEAGIHPRKMVTFLERHMSYNLFSVDEKFLVAISDDLKNIRPFFNLVGEEEITPYVLHGKSIETIKIRIEEIVNQTKKSLHAEPVLKEWL